MGRNKSNYVGDSTHAKSDGFSKPTNIADLIKKHKIAEQKDKSLQILTLVFYGLILLLVTFILL